MSVSNNGASDLDIWTTVDCLFVQFIFYCSVYLFNCLGKAGADWAARVRPQSPGQSFQGSTQRNTFENFDKKKAPPPKKINQMGQESCQTNPIMDHFEKLDKISKK